MTSWRPKTDLEDEIVSIQPDHVFIYGELTDQQRKHSRDYQARPRAHLDYLDSKIYNNRQKNSNQITASPSHALNAIRAVHKICGTKQIGEHATADDWNTRENVEHETIAMIRHFGMGPSMDSLNERTTLPTLPVKNNLHVVHNGQKTFPVIFDDDYFAIESTRMREAKIVNKINVTSKGPNSSLSIGEIRVLNEKDVEIESEDLKKKKELEKYKLEYPCLKELKQQKKCNKRTTDGSCNYKPSSRAKPIEFSSITADNMNTTSSENSFHSCVDDNSSAYMSANDSFNSIS